MQKVVYFVMWMLGLLASIVCYAQEMQVIQEAPEGASVEVYGRANLGNGQSDTVLLKQQGSANPLGNPIVFSSMPKSNVENGKNDQLVEQSVTPQGNVPQNIVQENLPQNPLISPQEMPQIVNKQIQNTLYESGGRIYDIQSYPDSDISYVEQPNFGNTITTYPAY